MLKVVIIDDEPLVLEGLRSMVEWEEHGYKLVGEAADGEEGYELISQVNPDLVITDMRMPVMDGIELMEKCQEQLELKARFVVLSGYSEFSYVKRALELKSLQYLLKPIDPDEIHQMLLDLSKKIIGERDKEEKMQQDLRFILEGGLKRLLSGDMKPSIINRVSFILNTDRSTAWAVGRIVVYDMIGLAEELRRLKISSVREHIKSSSTDNDTLKLEIVETLADGFSFVLFGAKFDDNMVGLVYSRLIDELESRGIPVSIISSQVGNILSLSSSAVSVEYGLRAVFYGPRYHLYDCVPQNFVKLEQGDNNTLLNLIEEDKGDQVIKYIEGEFLRFRSDSFDPEQVRARWMAMFGRVLSSEMVTPEGKAELSQSMAEVRKFGNASAGELKDAFLAMTGQILTSLEEAEGDDPVSRVKTYVAEHYHRDIKIKHVAEVLGFNPVYLGQLFQKRAGVKYNDYVLNLRMKKAEELLIYSGKKIKEVALSVGYKNPDYFMLKFKESKGMSPLEFRKRHQV